jgi:hypothetical protein
MEALQDWIARAFAARTVAIDTETSALDRCVPIWWA